MAIPVVEPYPMPGPGDVPGNAASWRLDARRSVLLIHDMQKYFLRPMHRAEALHRQLVDNIARVRSACDRSGIPVVYTAQPGGMTAAERGLLHDFWGPGMSVAPVDRDITDELAP